MPPAPSPDVPSSVRFLYHFDNLLLSYTTHRSRVPLGPEAIATYTGFAQRT